MTAPVGVLGVGVEPVADAHYAEVAARLIRGATARCLVNVFILDPRPDPAGQNAVMALIEDLRAAAWRGADVRVLIGGSRTNLDIAEASRFGCDACRSLGLESRWLTASDVRGSHVKALVADQHVLVGSHNWTNGALGGQVQDSVLVNSAALASALAREFEFRWREALP